MIPFEKISDEQSYVGSKAFILAQMSKRGLPVPRGLILTELPSSEQEWAKVFSWWEFYNFFPLAVRSSAFGEDSKEMSFAGQNQTFLNVKTQQELRRAIEKCFSSIDREASKSYRKFFTGTDAAIPMNVVLQQMVDAKYSGVFFSENPLAREEGALIEYIEGFGEALVSGSVNPYRLKEFRSTTDGPLSLTNLKDVFQLGKKVEEAMNEKIDMEWAIDKQGQLFFLQARPITATRSKTSLKTLNQKEFSRLEATYSEDTWWDGQTFCEWTGTPSQLSYDVWRMAFAPGAALDKSLQELNYSGFGERDFSPNDSILDQIYGRPMVNMTKMLPLYFGPIPYVIAPKPRPHLKFSFKKMSLLGFIRTPLSMLNMLQVAWKLSTQRRSYIERARKELLEFRTKLSRPSSSEIYKSWSDEELFMRWEKEILRFATLSLKWPLVIAVLIESTNRALLSILESVHGAKKATEIHNHWMGAGLHTASYEMNRSFRKAQEDSKKQEFFLANYGHRGPGELDLANPRWLEVGTAAFQGTLDNAPKILHQKADIAEEVHTWKTLKESIILEEWNFLKELLELREQWKMEILRPYAHIRFLSLEMSRRKDLGLDLFQLSVSEIKAFNKSELSLKQIRELIAQRKLQAQAYRSVYIPDVLNKSDLSKHVFEEPSQESSYKGLSLSGGLVRGRVKIVGHPSEVNFSEWPEDTILVTAATDPGWTPLLTRVKGVIVERGGVLSHCAIVAREMSLPALNMAHATEVLKEGDLIFLDADRGSVSYEPRA